MSHKPATSIYCLIATRSPMAVVFRRGPAKLVQMLKWNLIDDSFEKGQWFKGRIYEHYCDLSPSGKYLVYWAGNHREPYHHWTAVSKPPYLTALCLWPNVGMDGGGIFASEDQLLLTTFSIFDPIGGELSEALTFYKLEDNHLSPLGPVTEHRLRRGGWIQTQQGIRANPKRPPDDKNFKGEILYPLDPIDIWRKPSANLYLELRTLGLLQVEGRPHVTEYCIVSATTDSIVLDLDFIDWADWDRNGDLLYAKSGCIFRFPAHTIGSGAPLQLVDLTDATFEPLEAPEEFKKW